MDKAYALAKHLGVDNSEISGDDDVFSYGREDYLVLTDDEAEARVAEEIENSLWAFKTSFVAAHASVGLSGQAIEALARVQAELSEDANDLMRALIKDWDHFVQDAIRADGRGHFLSPYDGEENEIGWDTINYFIYRIN